MSISSTTEKPVILRAQDRQSLVPEADFPPVRHFIDGTFRPGSSGRTLAVVDPSSGRTIAHVADGTAEDTDTAVAAAVAAAPRWGRLTPKDRSDLLHKVADRLAGHADLLARLESAQHRQTAGRGARRHRPGRRHVPLHGRCAARNHRGGRRPLRRGSPVGHPARAAGCRGGRDPRGTTRC